jgi:outer membrane receptor protein involved in Fe transport
MANDVQPYISRIPLSAIERIEVLPDGASAIYGGGGAINIVLRRDYKFFDARTVSMLIFDRMRTISPRF